ncbi:hypothetical protein [Roseimaritima ulvae]|uniref:Uncharacterized protein n=1 Tax=Roseimaritima ulvae TaxID=980254 RepID=A0A5B9QSQ6_9BACT|nr:hypothetical protein [Roseimaritima ulvae]QEG40760.1 hypothetical protein UC8_27770 [Roseimaritima ulvae]
MIAPIQQGYPPQGQPPLETGLPRAASADDTQESTVVRLIGEHPVVAVAAAATLGVVLGWVVKRR